MNQQFFPPRSRRRVGVDELLEQACRDVDPRDPASLMALAEPLHALAGDAGLLQDCIHHGLSHWRQGLSRFYSSQSCLLASRDHFALRINLWPLLPADPRRRAILADVLSYFDYHDHNFSFITANYFGPGYETEIYDYDRADVTGYPGEPVALRYRGRYRLAPGVVLLFEQFRDIHMQLPPPALSASINLMLTPPDAGLTNQYYFDVDRGIVRDYVASYSHKRVNALGFARHLHDAETPALLLRILETHPCSRTRVEAAGILAEIEGAAALPPASLRKLLADPLCAALWAQRGVS